MKNQTALGIGKDVAEIMKNRNVSIMPTEIAEIPSIALRISNEIESLAEIQQSLSVRLDKFIRFEPENEATECYGLPPSKTEFGSELAALCDRLNKINYEFRWMLDRLGV